MVKKRRRKTIKEIWKDIKGFEGIYQVSNMGNVKSLDRQVVFSDGRVYTYKSKIMNQRHNEDGYAMVHLSKNGYDRYYGVHRLVATAFLENPCNYQEVNHKNCIRDDNIYTNLEWCTHRDNVHYAIKLGRHFCNRDLTGANNPNYKNTTLKKYYEENPEEKKKLSRKATQNGMATPVTLLDINKNFIKRFEWIGGCAEYLIQKGYTKATVDGIRNRITIAIKNNQPYLKHYFQK